MNKYDFMNVSELVNLLNSRDIEIGILNSSYERLVKENLRLKKKFADIVLDLGLDVSDYQEMIKTDFEKDPDSGFEGSTLFPKGEGRLVVENDEGKAHIWD